MTDETLICTECNAEFIFTAGEQEFYTEKGFLTPDGELQKPRKCKPCRDAAKANRYRDRNKEE